MVSSLAELYRSNVVDVDLGSAEFKAKAHRHMAEWARRPPFYVLGKGPPQVVVGRYADVHRVFSDTETFKSEMPRGAGWEQFNKIMFAQFVTQMDGEQHARVRRLMMPAFSSRRIEQLQDSITRIVDGMLDRIEANGQQPGGILMQRRPVRDPVRDDVQHHHAGRQPDALPAHERGQHHHQRIEGHQADEEHLDPGLRN